MLKTPVEVESGYIITYTIRVYNEGSISGYVREIVDNIPEGLEYIANSTINQKYGWFMLDKNKGFTDKPEEAVYLATNYLADISEETKGSNLIKAYDGGETLDYKDVQIQFKVTYKVTKEAERGKQLINIAQIASAISENGNEEIKDRDSKPNYDDPYNFKDKTKNEDDIDYEDVVVRYFDLTLKKFVSAINGTPVNNRAPEVKYEDEKIKYTMKTEPVDVTKGEINLLFKDGAYFIMFHFFMEYYFYEAYLKTAQLFNSLRADIVKDIKSKYIVLLVLYLIVSILLFLLIIIFTYF